eukprot:CAMPEP_0194396566 /NCGR_PEP_ID=MMETSP0174-20130528/125061_1 /TAXON_ID=216777 /ORGANISM="Proboscia alata, Strain PI-D3" /LENGTH=561 /DNA_ID=CAMNT_0039192649 /DNA_START=9 /DNA_END=1694 /DNA_ORIENTATION=+
MTRRRRHEMEDEEDDRNMVSYHRHHPPSPAQTSHHPINFDDTEFVDGQQHEHGFDSPRERDYEHEHEHQHDTNQHEHEQSHELPEQEQSQSHEQEDEEDAADDFEEEQAEEEEGEDDGTVDNDANDPSSNVDFLKATPTIQFDDDNDDNEPQTSESNNNNKESPSMREIGHEAVWSLSTAKPGNGVDQIRDASPDTYWQSDGGQPHLINIQFSRRASVGMVAFYLDYNLDESYTPKRLSVRVGMTCHDLVEVRVVEMSEPIGWVCVRLNDLVDVDDGWMMEEEDEEEVEEEPEVEVSQDDAATNPADTTASTRPSTNAPDNNNTNPPNAHTTTPNPPTTSTTTTTTTNISQKMAKERQKRIRDEWKKRRQALPVRAHFIQICVVSIQASAEDATTNSDTNTASTRPTSTNAPGNNNTDPPSNAHNNPPPTTTTTSSINIAQKMAKERNKRIRDEWKKRRQALPVRAHFIQICVVSMHQNGRDTHIRQVKIFGPKNIRNNRVLSTRMPCFAPAVDEQPDSEFVQYGAEPKDVPVELPLRRPMELLLMQEFTTVQMTQFDSIR